MKVSVDAKALYNLYDVLNSMKASQSNIIKIARDMVSDMLPVLDLDGIPLEEKFKRVPDSAWKIVQGNTPYDITDDDRRWADEELQKHDDSQIPVRYREANIQAIKESLTKNSCKITVSSIPEIQNLIDLELINHRAILQILDIMMNSTCNRGWNRDTEMRTQIKELHKQLRGVKYELQ